MESAELHLCLAQLYNVTGIPLVLLSRTGKRLYSWPETPQDLTPDKFARYVIEDFLLQNRSPDAPLVAYVEPGYFIGTLQLEKELFCLLGMVSPFQHTWQEVLSICGNAVAPPYLQAFCTTMMQLPLVSLGQLKDVICLLYRLLRGSALPPENILFSDNTAPRLHSAHQLGQALFEAREETEFHVPTNYEAGVCEAIEAGSPDLLERRLRRPAQGRVGQMSLNPLRQQKYAFVSFATLLSRAAIRGGLPAETAFSLSDIYCQRADQVQEIPRIEQLTYAMAVDFCTRVAENKGSHEASPAIRKCLGYISAHLHESIALSQLSDCCGLCTRALSLRFRKEMGTTIPDYIHGEKTKEAQYLLVQTEYTLAEISEFLGYPSQSYFTQQFKKCAGLTPQQYRETPRLHGG